MTDDVTTVTNPFTERLLRDLIPLTAEQQRELVQDLIKGKIDKATWQLIGTTFEESVPTHPDQAVPPSGTAVPSPFTEVATPSAPRRGLRRISYRRGQRDL